MFRQFKTGKKNRTRYIYYTADGTKIVINPAENGVTEADIDLLHSMDDIAFDQQRRYDSHVLHIDAYRSDDDESIEGRNR